MGDRGVFSNREGHVGLDHYQVRSWIGWHHHTVLAMLALTILVADAHHTTPSPRDPDGRELLKLSTNEIRHLMNVLIIRPTKA